MNKTTCIRLLLVLLLFIFISGCDYVFDTDSIEIVGVPNRIIYTANVDTELDLSGLKAVYTSSDDSIYTIPLIDLIGISSYIYHEIDFSTPGVYEVIINYPWGYEEGMLETEKDMVLSYSFLIQVVDIETFKPDEPILQSEPSPMELEAPFEQIGHQASIVQISYVNDRLLYNFVRIHEFDYTRGHGSEIGFDIVFFAGILMKSFSIIKVECGFIEGDSFFVVRNSWLVADEVLPGEAVIVKNYHGIGELPDSGFSFIDENGITRYYTFVENMGFPREPGPFVWIINEYDTTTGEIIAFMVS